MIKRKNNFEDYKCYLKNIKIKFRSQQKFESEARNVFIEKFDTIDDVTDKNKNDNNPNWRQILSHPYRI